MTAWDGVNAQLVVADIPFGRKFTGKASNYNRNADLVVDGYVEWNVEDYADRVTDLMDTIDRNLSDTGSALVVSGWQHSRIVHELLEAYPAFDVQGKYYWAYNFAPYCKKRPAHNVYEIFWVTRKKHTWTFTNTCATTHCTDGEANLSVLTFKRDYKRGMPKYPTRLPLRLLQCLIQHHTRPGDLVLDPLAGSGMTGIAAQSIGRDVLLGDLNTNGKRVFESLLGFYQLSPTLQSQEAA